MASASHDYVMSDTDDVADYDIIDETDVLTPKDWLKPTDFDGEGSEYRRHLSSHATGTNEWLLSTLEWSQWHDTAAHGFLRLTGIPGSGKSVLAAHLVHHLSKEEVPVLFFFFRQIIDANHSPRALLRDWLTQLLPFSQPLQAEIEAVIKSHRALDTISIDDLWRLLRIGLSDQRKVYAIADALDEMDAGNEAFLHALAELGRLKPAVVKVLVTARPVPVVDVALRQVTKLQVRLEETRVDIDISRYVSQRLEDSDISTEEQDLIRSAVPGRANGLFLYARLAMDGFLEPNADVRDVLRCLPSDLNCMYADLLNEHARRSGAPMDLQVRVLQWVTHASRPLRLLELSEIIGFRPDHKSPGDLGSAKALVRVSCGPLIEMLPDETLSVCHHSLTEFLKGWTRSDLSRLNSEPYPILRPAPTHLDLALSCLQYLSAGCLDACALWPNEKEVDARVFGWSTQSRMQMEHPFSIYAARNWHIHATKAIEHGISKTEMAALNDAMDEVLRSDDWRRVLLQIDEQASLTEGIGRLHVAAWAGLEDYAKRLLDEGEQMNKRDKAGNTPLHWAASFGRGSVASLLLKRGAKNDLDNGVGLKPLHEASSKGHAAIVSLLLQAGVDPMTAKTKENPGRRCGNARVTVGHTALMYACNNGHVDAVNAYLPFLRPDQKAQALIWATSSGHGNVIRDLTQQPEFDVDVIVFGETALLVACRCRHLDIIHLLLQSGADPNIICEKIGTYQQIIWSADRGYKNDENNDRGHTPMHAFAKRTRDRRRHLEEDSDDIGRKTITALEALIMAGGRVNSVDHEHKTVLHYTCADGGQDSPSLWNAMLTKLIDVGADASIPDVDGQTPLHMCLDDPTGHGLRLLVNRGGADINRPDAEGCVPLMSVLKNSGNCSAALNLLKLHPDCNVMDNNGNTPLHLAMQGGKGRLVERQIRDESKRSLDEKIIAAMLAAGADPGARNLRGETPLHFCRLSDGLMRTKPDFRAEKRIILMLLEKGANLETKDHLGQTLLFRKIRNRSRHWTDEITFLLGLGCDLHTTDFAGRGILHELVRSNHEPELLEFCISQGCDPALKDHNGNTIFHEVAVSDRWKSVLPYHQRSGTSPNQRNNAGQTPLLIASGVVHSHNSPSQRSTALNAFIQICEDPNAVDNRGVTPIHMASSVSEAYVMKLLEVGASLSATTSEGLNALHIAARARQSNIVGYLCELSLASKDKETRTLIDATDSEGRTPLHHACRSGRPETVAILLRAGATTNIRDRAGLTPFSACVEFEKEDLLWSDAGALVHSGQSLRISEISQETKDRPKWYFENSDGSRTLREKRHGQLDNEHRNARLDEILDLLISYETEHSLKSQQFRNKILNALSYAALHKLDYTFNCFKTIRDRLGLDEVAEPANFELLSAEYRVAATSKAFWECKKPTNTKNSHTILLSLLIGRQYDLVKEVVRQDGNLYTEHGKTLFIRWGFADLLASTDQDAAESAETAQNGMNAQKRSGVHESDAVTACRRELPNTESLRALKRQRIFQVNEQSIKKVFTGECYEFVHAETALHELADGTYWWYVAEGMPFLLSIGANIDARDEAQRTPLHVALIGSYKAGLHRKRAATFLIERGADVTAVDSAGQPCLAMTEDRELIALLMKHGARKSPSALFNAVRNGKPSLLKHLLSLDMDPNHRLEFEQGSAKQVERLEWLYTNQYQREKALPHAENLVLYYAATCQDFGVVRPKGVAPDEELVQILLAHGADPYRTFRRPEAKAKPESNQKTLRVPDMIDDDDQNITEQTLIHQVLYEQGRFQPFLELSGLDLELRDSKGCTLLLAACHHSGRPTKAPSARAGESLKLSTFTEQLIERGADLSARDNDGNNALHICLASKSPMSKSTVMTLVDRASFLVRQTNSQGETPFHLAMKRGELPVISCMLPFCENVKSLDADGSSVLHHVVVWMARLDYSRNSSETEEEAQSRYQATSAAFFALLQRFINDGVDINSRNNKGETPFMRLVKDFCKERCSPKPSRFKSNLQVLRDAGADIFIPDACGATPLHLLAAVPFKDIISRSSERPSMILELFTYLVSLGLDPFAEDDKKRTSLDVASANGNQNILALFEKDK